MAKPEAYMEGVHYEELPPSSGKLKHPPGLKILFMTEMWERFSFYGMRALLVLYLVKALNYPKHQALMVYAIYSGLIYITPILGGYIADRWLGARKGLFIGSLIMMMGHFAMAFESWLYFALGLLILGNGFFKPNASLLVGRLYSEENAILVPAGYTIFYMGINLGALLSPLIAGTLGEHVHWSYGFGAAGIGMMIGFITLFWGQKLLGGVGLPPGQESLTPRDWSHIFLIALAAVPFFGATFLLWDVIDYGWHATARVGHMMIGLSIFVLVFAVPFFSSSRHNPIPLTYEEWRQIFVLGVIFLFVICFWIGFEQAGGRMSLFVDEHVDRTILGFKTPTSWFQALNPLLIVILAPIMAWVWGSVHVSNIVKQAFGLLALSLGFMTMGLASHEALVHGRISPLWLCGVFFFNTLGELMVSPIGLTLFSQLSPARFASMLMGMWFLASGIANYLAGVVGAEMEHHTRIPFFWLMALVAGGAGILLLSLSPWLNRWAGETHAHSRVASGVLPLEGPGNMGGRTQAIDLVD